MSWADVRGGLSSLADSPAESQRFGYSFGRISVGSSWNEEYPAIDGVARAVLDRIESSAMEIVVLRAPSEVLRLAYSACPSNRKSLHAGTLMYWGTEIEAYVAAPARAELTAGPPSAGDSRTFDAIAQVLADSFDGYVNHYLANPLLDPDLVAAGYQEWAARTMSDAEGQVEVLQDRGRIVGVATSADLHMDGGVCEIQLAGMVPDSQGRGLYRHLLDAVVDGAARRGNRHLVISTQSHNISVQRAWASAGLKPLASVDTTHLVAAHLWPSDETST